MMLVERCPTGKQLSISGGLWLLCLANPLTGQRAGDPLPLGYNFSDADAAAATGSDGVLNVWVEPKPGVVAGEPLGPDSWASGVLGAGLAWTGSSHVQSPPPPHPPLSLYFLQCLRLVPLPLQLMLPPLLVLLPLHRWPYLAA